MIKEAVLVCKITNGGCSFNDVINYPLDRYFKLVEYCNKLQPKEQNHGDITYG